MMRVATMLRYLALPVVLAAARSSTAAQLRSPATAFGKSSCSLVATACNSSDARQLWVYNGHYSPSAEDSLQLAGSAGPAGADTCVNVEDYGTGDGDKVWARRIPLPPPTSQLPRHSSCRRSIA